VRRKLHFTTMALGLMLVASMLAGAGVSALFSDRATATQVVTIGEMRLQLSSDTPGTQIDGQSLICPSIHIVESVGGIDEACHIRVESVGDIDPGAVTLSVRAETDGADLAKFGVDMYRPGEGWDTDPGWMPLSTALQYVGSPADPLSSDAMMRLGWGYDAPFGTGSLTESDMGKTVTVIYTLDAVE
jgi:predicted ribosomally synthesized peptide with SipW-like signal peptide